MTICLAASLPAEIVVIPSLTAKASLPPPATGRTRAATKSPSRFFGDGHDDWIQGYPRVGDCIGGTSDHFHTVSYYEYPLRFELVEWQQNLVLRSYG
jgi:hypothetical protein